MLAFPTSKSPRAGKALRLVVIALALILGGSVPEAHGDGKRLVFTQFSGRNGKKVRAGVIELVRKNALVWRYSDFADLLQEQNRDLPHDEAIAAAAQKMGLDGVVSGKVTRVRGWYTLAIALRSAGDGALVTELSVELGRKPRLSRHARRVIRRDLLPAIAELESQARRGSDDSPAAAADPGREEVETDGGDAGTVSAGRKGRKTATKPGGQKGKKAEPTRVAASRGRNPAKPAGRSSALSATTEKPGQQTVAQPSAASDNGPHAVALAVGASMLGRRLSFETEGDVALTPFAYRGLPMPAARIRGELYPFDLLGASGFASNIAGSFAFERVLFINSTVEGSAISIPTLHQRWGVGVHYRLPLGNSPRSPSLLIGAGYDQIEFSLDRRALMDDVIEVDLPDVDYLIFYPTLAFRLPLGPFVLFARSAYLFISDAGQIEAQDAYGDADAWGIEAELGAELRLSRHWRLRLASDYTHISFSFKGLGELRDRDSDGTDDVNGAVDQYFSAYLTAGFRY